MQNVIRKLSGLYKYILSTLSPKVIKTWVIKTHLHKMLKFYIDLKSTIKYVLFTLIMTKASQTNFISVTKEFTQNSVLHLTLIIVTYLT